ncbi:MULTISPECIES: hypothetical protein [unclassified Methylobacterium]|nr:MULTISPECIES: hypothetical protein [unclassified Methylobacterium]
MTGELVFLALLMAGGGLLYVYLSGKAFDRKYPRRNEGTAPAERQTSGH